MLHIVTVNAIMEMYSLTQDGLVFVTNDYFPFIIRTMVICDIGF